MIDIVPLFLLWAAGQGKGKPATKPALKPPKWPTPKSPPPMPAFKARKTAPPSADPGKTSTPLATLHKSPPVPPPASAIDTAKQAATRAVRKRASQLLARQAATFNPFGKKAAATAATSTALVSQLQSILSAHGVNVTRDGLYGPRTASAWSSLAKRKGLPGAISREGPQIAKVVTQTFERLSVPPIP
jgi:hypothetical protein